MGEYEGSLHISSEKDFVYRSSTNRGHVQLPRMVVNCRKLSATAKIIYSAISAYVYEQGGYAFPSIARISMSANISRKTAIKYIEELITKGFIVRARNGNRLNNNYYLVDADRVGHLRVSEMFHGALRAAADKLPSGKYEELVDVLMRIEEDIPDDQFGELPTDIGTEQHLIDVLIRRVNKEDAMFKPPNKKSNVPEVQDSALGGTVNKVGGFSSAPNAAGLPDDLDKWRVSHFVRYFYECYERETGSKHEVATAKHAGMFGRILKNVGDNHSVKKRIDAFFEIGYDLKSLEWFSTAARASEIDLYLTAGKKPFYLDKGTPIAAEDAVEQAVSGMSPEDFLKRIKKER